MYNLILCTLMVPISALVIPITQLNSRMGLLDNYFGLIFPYIALNIPYAVTILQGFMKGVPKELERQPDWMDVILFSCTQGLLCQC